jgi:nucleolar protein 53
MKFHQIPKISTYIPLLHSAVKTPYPSANSGQKMAEISNKTLPPAQHSQPSRKNKRAWRKNVDLSEVDKGLEKVRDDKITSGYLHSHCLVSTPANIWISAVVAELPSSELFVTDTTGEVAIRDRAAKKRKLLRADEILAQRSAVPALEGRVRVTGNVTNGIIVSQTKKSSVNGKDYERLRKIAYGGQTVTKDVIEESHFSADFDPWVDHVTAVERKRLAAEGALKDVQKEVEAQLGTVSFLNKRVPLKEPTTLKTPPISQAADGRQVKSVRKPAAEKSYNPTFQEWSQRLERLGAAEAEAELKRLEAAAKEAERQRMIEQTQREVEEDIARGLDNSDWESEWDGIQSETEQVPAKKRPERKTPAQRNKTKRRKEEEALKKHEQKQREKDQQSQMIKKLAKEVKAAERLKEEQKQSLAIVEDVESSDDGDDVELRRRRPFGKKYVILFGYHEYH